MKMKKEEVKALLERWIEEGKLFTAKSGGGYYHVYRKTAMGKCTPTVNKSLYAADKETADTFNELCQSGAIMSSRELIKRLPEMRSHYSINAACMRGELLRVQINGVIIYVMDE